MLPRVRGSATTPHPVGIIGRGVQDGKRRGPSGSVVLVACLIGLHCCVVPTTLWIRRIDVLTCLRAKVSFHLFVSVDSRNTLHGDRFV